ncbi:polysaccharide biosynthesis/export family protein [Hymenobacter sp. 15J16-1T3B]|uniref:polysaccharide biosynthesis/export family protein n=1 Tax=Hymenobacter sp. 15J16-1T3B TaxID=2886941 RepID=UPI001D12129C|nr:polysaccharide biosynthesis/export family protein [Hymenobacter sp. 15J16-1T3B]MCC3157825.1 polysaccharide biosynthesis/export family protein [Hymenobacter sp. 15J16-1T3B]
MHLPAFRCLRQLWLPCLLVVLGLSSCSKKIYNQRVMFKMNAEGQMDTAKVRRAVNRANRNYTIQNNDLLAVRVYTNSGERIIDPNGELRFGNPAGLLSTGANGSRTLSNVGGQGGGAGTSSSAAGESEFLVQTDGYVKLPLVNRVRVQGLTLMQADSLLQVRYSEFYKGVFVTTRVTNNRVVVLGSPGGKIVPLVNDNMNLLEVLAAAGGVDGAAGGAGSLYRSGGNVSNVRIIRGDLKNPQVEIVDLTTIAGMRRANLQMEPNDIVYIEPVRRPFYDSLNDAAPVLGLAGLVLNTAALIITIIRYNSN